MTGLVRFLYFREGPSDDGLLPHLRLLLVRYGASEAIGIVNESTGSVEEKLLSVRGEIQAFDAIFVHRDSDSQDHRSRLDEIASAAEATKLPATVIPVVPVQELEAWLLTSESAIREVVGRPSGKEPLSLPKLAALERTGSPKELLKVALSTASNSTGRRR